MTEKLNFVMTGSIAGGRGLEALLVLRQLPLATDHFGRCVVVIWEKEAKGDIFDALKLLPVDILVTREPKRTSFGFMEQQYKSLLAAMPYFSDEDIIVRIRTDYNYVLSDTLGMLNRILDAGKSARDILRGRLICGEVSILYPGRIQEFNFAATKKTLRIIGWCESFFTNDYNPVAMEPEFRWFGLEFVRAEPLFHYCYENRNMRALMRRFFEDYYPNGRCDVAELPPITKYISWRIANIALERFICCLNLGPRNIDPNMVFNADKADVSVFHDNIPDIRLTSHSVLADIANIDPKSPNWSDFSAVAEDIAAEERKKPGHAIELFESTFGAGQDGSAILLHSGQGRKYASFEHTSDIFRLVDHLQDNTSVPFSSFRDYPSDILHALRSADKAATIHVADHILASTGLRSQMINRFATFCVTVLCRLTELGEIRKATNLLAFITHEAGATEELVRVVAFRSKRFPAETTQSQNTHYELPEAAIEHDMLRDLVAALSSLAENASDANKTLTANAFDIASIALSSKPER